MKLSTKNLVKGAVIAAIYTALTYLAAAANLAYLGVQFRFSEALTILPVFTPAAIPGLTVGCFLSNIFSPYPLDMVFGTAASLLAAISTYLLRNVKIKGMPVLAPLPPVIFNAVIIGAQIAMTMSEGFNFANFFLFAFQVGLGQLVVCYALGLPLYCALEKSGASRLLTGK